MGGGWGGGMRLRGERGGLGRGGVGLAQYVGCWGSGGGVGGLGGCGGEDLVGQWLKMGM